MEEVDGLAESAVSQGDGILLGRRTDERGEGEEFLLDPAWFTRGAVVVGKSGTGKSHDIDLIAGQLGQLGHSCVILDRTGEHAEAFAGSAAARVLRPGEDVGFRLLDASDPSLSDPAEATEDILDTLTHYFAVSFGQRPTPLQQRIVRENLQTHFTRRPGRREGPSVSAFISMVRRYQEFKKGVHGFPESCEAVVSRLFPLSVGRLAAVFDRHEGGSSVEELFGPGVHVVDLSPLGYEPAKNLLSQILVKLCYQAARRKGRTDRLRQLIVADEAHHIAPRDYDGQSVLDLMAIENRKYGQGTLVASTSPSQLSETLLRNSSVRVCHLLDDGKDIDLMLRFMVNRLEGERYIADMRMLEVGEAVAQVSVPVSLAPCRVRVRWRD
jgi:Helicase HerA, central domain